MALAQRLMTSLILVEDSSSDLPVLRLNTRGGGGARPRTGSSSSSSSSNSVPMYLPLSLLPKHLFGCLPHLASPGMQFTLRPSMTVAILAYLSDNKFLSPKAKAFLEANIGQWINLAEIKNVPEVLSEENVKLLRRVPEFLTAEEDAVYQRLYLVWRIRIAFRQHFTVKIALSPDVKTVYPDYRFV